MDITPKYIKMCEMAKEIQDYWEIHTGDYYFSKYTEMVVIGLPHFSYKTKDHYIWLLRQDQLQEMIGTGVFFVLEAFNQFVFHEYGPYCVKTFHSREQLWLAFVMKEKFNKMWDEKKEEWTEDNQ